MASDRHERHFHEELQEVNDLLLAMTNLVVEIFDDTVDAFIAGDAKTARKLLDERGQVDSLEIAIEERCLAMIALYQPVAIDLRNIITAINVIRDLERIDDISMDICHNAIFLSELDHPGDIFGIEKLEGEVKKMVHDAVRSFIKRDTDWARRICEYDDIVDESELITQKTIIEYIKKHPEHAEAGFHYSSAAKQLERIGDHCTNIAEMVIYLMQAKIIKHHYDVENT
ncbi:MAG: phosphate signaling complex protein PhoU [bacterium]|nr:phosphate signaling complex protein PhoU [bacterium]